MATTHLNNFKVDGKELKIVNQFIFLGSLINENAKCDQEIKGRLQLGRIAMKKLEKIWKSKEITIVTKKRLVEALLFPVALYGCEAWTTKKTDRKKMEAFELWCWRRMLRISWTERVTKEREVLDKAAGKGQKILSLEAIALKRKMSYFGRIVRKNEGIENIMMTAMSKGKRRRGKQRTKWLDGVKGAIGMTLEELTRTERETNGKALSEESLRIAHDCKSTDDDKPF